MRLKALCVVSTSRDEHFIVSQRARMNGGPSESDSRAL